MTKKQPEKLKKLKKLWVKFGYANLILAISGSVISLFSLSKLIAAVIGLAIFIFILGLTIILGWSQIPHKRVWIVEIFGEYVGEPLKAGLYILFPYLGFVDVKAEVFLGQQMLELFMNDEVKEGYGKGHVDFKDASAPVDATCFFTIHDPEKAVYKIEPGVLEGIADKIDGAIRSYLGSYSINEANTLKVQFHLETILNGVIIKTDEAVVLPSNTSRNFIDENDSATGPRLWQEIWDTWGASIDSIVISDIQLSQDLMNARAKELIAEAEAKAAIHTKQKTITLAEGENRSLELYGEGITSQVDKLMALGASYEEAVAYLTNRKKWESMEKAGKTVLIEGASGNMAGAGAAFAAGAGAMQSTGGE